MCLSSSHPVQKTYSIFQFSRNHAKLYKEIDKDVRYKDSTIESRLLYERNQLTFILEYGMLFVETDN